MTIRSEQKIFTKANKVLLKQSVLAKGNLSEQHERVVEQELRGVSMTRSVHSLCVVLVSFNLRYRFKQNVHIRVIHFITKEGN